MELVKDKYKSWNSAATERNADMAMYTDVYDVVEIEASCPNRDDVQPALNPVFQWVG